MFTRRLEETERACRRRRRHRSLAGAWGVALAKALVLAVAPAGSAETVRGDFSGDGFADLAIGAPGEDGSSGIVHVIYGSAGGLDATGAGGAAPLDQLWSQASPGIGDAPEPTDRFGFALATGDFNGDGFADLAIGVPGENHSGATSAGVVHVIYGSILGLNAFGFFTPAAQLWSQASPGLSGFSTPESYDSFGWALTTGDFNGDGFAELAIGAPGENGSSGVAHVIYGSAGGLQSTSKAPQLWSEALPAVLGQAEPGDRFGATLAAGAFNGDGFADLAIGAPGENVGAGAVHVLYGTAFVGLQATGLGGAPEDQFWSQLTMGIGDEPENEDGFGRALATGDFNGDGVADLAIGAPFENLRPPGLVTTITGCGVVHVIYGSASGLQGVHGRGGPPSAQLWSQASPGIQDTLEPEDWFGFAVAAGDFNGDGFADLGIGVPGEGALAGGIRRGAAHVIYGSGSGLQAQGSLAVLPAQLVLSDSFPYEGVERFGTAVAAGDFDGDGRADLGISAPFIKVYLQRFAGGRVEVLYGSGGGFQPPAQVWQQANFGLPDFPELFDVFGASLASGT